MASAAAGCDRQRPGPPARGWATWPMPNSPGLGLPHERSYAVSELVVTDNVTGLTWQRGVAAQRYAWNAAKQACEALVLAGFDDWRLPSRVELVSLIENGRVDPAIDLQAFPFVIGGGPTSDWFWTSTASAGEPSKAWYVYFYFGYPDVDEQTSEMALRCVRGGRAAPPGARYQITAETVRDVGTGLVWQRQAAPGHASFAEASQRCADLTLGDSADWRLPTLTELETLVDDTRTNPAIDTTAFPDARGDLFWTSTIFSGSAARAWYVRFDAGGGLYERDDVSLRARCVR